jgi:hypothetical protein
MQRFKKMDGYSLYEISNDGTIRRIVTKEIISQRIHPGYGYKMCDLQDNDLKVHTVYPHKEVARAYIPTKKKGKLYVIHVNGKQQDNKVNNLQWATPAEAQIHQLKMGFRKRLGNPELYKYSKYWKAKHAKKGKGKNIDKIVLKSKPIAKGKLVNAAKAKKTLTIKSAQLKKTAKVKPQLKKLVAKGKKVSTAKKPVLRKKAIKAKVNKLEKKNSKTLTVKKGLQNKKSKIKVKKQLVKKAKPSTLKKNSSKGKVKANKNLALNNISNINKASEVKKKSNKIEPKRGKRQRIKYRKIHSTKLK